mmetsp:Transcript_117598/g.339958  ORF Transcript_117598/g.339958 Transcript_117598/m.339958 type:complete len:367 (+) Transcript_117598:73-1173(+)
MTRGRASRALRMLLLLAGLQASAGMRNTASADPRSMQSSLSQSAAEPADEAGAQKPPERRVSKLANAIKKRKATPMDTLPPICGGAFVTSIVMYPADVVRAICMSNPGTGAGAALNGFVETHGLMGFVKQGLVAEVSRASISRAIKFFMQPLVHTTMYGKPESQGTPVSKGVAGAVGTVPEVIAISPLENIKLAAQLDTEGRFSGSASIAKHIMKTRGFSGLMIGYAGMQVRQCLWTGGFFLTLDWYKGGIASVTSNKLAQDVLSGFAAGATGTAMNCWTDVCRSGVQKQALAETFDAAIPRPSKFEPLNPGPFFAKAGEIMSSRGLTGLYSGVGPKMIHLGGSGALLAVLMPRFKSMWYDMRGLY